MKDLVERVGVAIRKARPGVNQQWEARCASAAIATVLDALKERAASEPMVLHGLEFLEQARKEALGDD